MKAFPYAAAVLLAGLALAAPAGAFAADPPRAAVQPPAIEPEATAALKKMSDYLATVQAFELTSQTSVDLVTVDGQKLQFDGVARYKARRPDGLVLEVSSDLKNRKYIYDGKTFTVFAPELGYYASIAAPPTIRQTLDTIYEKLGVALPLDDLFRWSDPGGTRGERLKSAFDVGSSKIDGVDTEQYAFREGDVDWQIWIKDGDQPLPVKLVIIDRTDPAGPAYTARLTWKINPSLTAEDFAFHPPKDAKAIRIGMVGK